MIPLFDEDFIFYHQFLYDRSFYISYHFQGQATYQSGYYVLLVSVAHIMTMSFREKNLIEEIISDLKKRLNRRGRLLIFAK
jgi:hypothetical protein